MMAATDPRVKKITVMGPTQLMKALDLSEVLPTPNGWTTIGQVAVGDELFDEKGKPCLVIGKSEIVENQTAKVKFSDGTEVISDLGHRWKVRDYTNHGNIKDKVITTEAMMANFKMNQGRNRYSIPLAEPIQCQDIQLPIDPYVLGVWLGDGHSYSSRLTCGASDYEEVRDLFSSRGYSLLPSNSKNPNVIESRIHDKDGTIHTKLKKLNLLKNKHIPQEYLRASIPQRFELLRGLMDSDGTIDTDGKHCSITMKREELCNNFVELCRSLGIKGLKRKHRALYKGEYRHYFMVGFTGYPNDSIFHLKRKTARLDGKIVKYNRLSDSKEIRIVNIKMHDIRKVQCIMVDSPSHLFLCSKSMIPTHNTELLNNIVGYFIHQDPSPIIVMQPTGKMAEAWSKDRLDKMLRDTPVLKDSVKEKRSRDSDNTILHKSFPGGHVTIVGSNSPSDLAMRPVRVVLCDEVDKYPASAGHEGDPIKLIEERSATFWNALSVRVCSPTVEGASNIEREYMLSDQRVFHGLCPFCNTPENLKWGQVHWENDKIEETAHYECSHCNSKWFDGERIQAISKGYYIAQAPFNGHAGFRCNKLASPWQPLYMLVQKWLEAQDSTEKLKTFINTQLAETWKERGEKPDYMRLYERRESYHPNEIPEGVVFLTAGADVQKDRIEVEIVGWGKDKQSWSIDYRVIMGQTHLKETWNSLTDLLNEKWRTSNGLDLEIQMLAVDSGFNTQHVYEWVRDKSPARVRAVKGSDTLSTVFGHPKDIDLTSKGNKLRRACKVWPVGVSIIKTELYGYLSMHGAGDDGRYRPGFCHFPQYNEEHFRRLCSEQLMRKKVNSRDVFYWTKYYERNEQLDCRVYARAAAGMFGIDRMRPADFEYLEDRLDNDSRTATIEKSEPSKVSQNGPKKDFWERQRNRKLF